MPVDPCPTSISAKVIHPQAADNYRVVLKDYIPEIEIGSIDIDPRGRRRLLLALGHRHGGPMRDIDAQGTGKDRRECMRLFRAVWERFSADPARLEQFLAMKRRRL